MSPSLFNLFLLKILIIILLFSDTRRLLQRSLASPLLSRNVVTLRYRNSENGTHCYNDIQTYLLCYRGFPVLAITRKLIGSEKWTCINVPLIYTLTDIRTNYNKNRIIVWQELRSTNRMSHSILLWTTTPHDSVLCSSQYSLLKSVQPDASSPTHGFNIITVYSRQILES